MVLTDNAIPRIGKGAISDTNVCVPTMDAPSANPARIFAPKYMAGVSDAYAIAIAVEAITITIKKIARQPNQFWIGPAATDPTTVMTLNMAFHSDCQYAGISMTPLISEAKVILIARKQVTGGMCSGNILLESWHSQTYRER